MLLFSSHQPPCIYWDSLSKQSRTQSTGIPREPHILALSLPSITQYSVLLNSRHAFSLPFIFPSLNKHLEITYSFLNLLFLEVRKLSVSVTVYILFLFLISYLIEVFLHILLLYILTLLGSVIYNYFTQANGIAKYTYIVYLSVAYNIPGIVLSPPVWEHVFQCRYLQDLELSKDTMKYSGNICRMSYYRLCGQHPCAASSNGFFLSR